MTHKNCFALVQEVRQGLNIYDDALARGDDTSSPYRNDTIIAKINTAVRELHALIAKRIPNEFLKEADVAGDDSVFVLPHDFGRLALLRDTQGRKVYSIDQVERRLFASAGSQRSYYRKGQSLVLDKAGISDVYKLVYFSKPREIHQGKFSIGEGDTVSLDLKFAVKINDYYNGMTIENVTQNDYATISSYTAAGVVTVDGIAPEDGDFYGLVPEIPEWAHHLIAPRATILLKQLPQTRGLASQQELSTYQDMLVTTLREFTAPSGDQDWEDELTSYEPKGAGRFTL